MPFARRITEILHEEHTATLALVATLDKLLAGGRQSPPDVHAAAARSTLEGLASAIESEVCKHFAFEEQQLFPRLAEHGDDALGQELILEHEAILPIGMQLSALARRALVAGFSENDWSEFFAKGADFTARLQPHVEKEERALLPIIDEIVDRETDFELCAMYAGSA